MAPSNELSGLTSASPPGTGQEGTREHPEASLQAVAILSERWTLLIICDAVMFGTSRFNDFQGRLGIAPSVLSARLTTLMEAGIFTRMDRTRKHAEYVLTAKGQGLLQVVVALTDWAASWKPDEDSHIV